MIPMRRNLAFLIGGVLIGAIGSHLVSPRSSQINLTALPPLPRIERPCLPDSDRTAVIVLLGQSNAANYGNTRYSAREAVDNFDPASGKCFAAADPLLGADGAGGNFGTRLGDLLIQAGRYDRVIVASFAVEGASLSALNNEHAERIDRAMSALQAAKLRPTHFLVQQGEKDAILTTTQQQYVSLLHQFVKRFRAAGFDAPFYLSRTTKCDVYAPTNVAAVRAAQLSAVNDQLNIRPGPDTDLIGNDGRNPHDGCHMNELGTLANAALWGSFIR